MMNKIIREIGGKLNNRTIYTAADGNYFLQAQVLLLSLVRTQHSPTTLMVFGNNWSPREIKRLKGIQSDLVSVEIQSVDTEKFSSIRLASKFPLATAYNVLAPQYLIATSGRALYVDADVVVTEDLSPLFDTEMKSPVAAVLDAHIGWVSSPSMWRPWREEGMEALTPYLNTGVMLIDLDAWRSNNLTQRILEILAKYDLPCVDQDAINIVLRGQFDQLKPRYKLMPYHYLQTFRYVDAMETDDAINTALTDPAIVHFHRSFLGKPWTYGAIHPATKLWRNLADEAHPGWRKSIDLIGYVRRRGARFAKMLKIDVRAREITSL
jgi:lipopolysaccharide biosynthesis glycosyltransferase